MRLTPYHAKYIAHQLTRRSASDSVERLTAVLSDAQVDLNPHQVEAALFAFRNPLARGAILADEVGLGKTIEAGLLVAQSWAERHRHVLVIVPANLRKQWSQELADKFFLPSSILEARTFNDALRAGNLNPFHQNAIIICSYQFARKMEPYIRQTRWDLVVIDEAHRLRNVYKPTNKIANSIKQSVAPFRKLLLTATPLQNSLLELYGLVSIIDDYTFGDLKTYRSRFTRLSNDNAFNDLKDRLRPICKRTLRKQVLEYVKYTNRHALVQEFVPTPEEQRLYDLVSEYLQQPTLYALPASYRIGHPLAQRVLAQAIALSTPPAEVVFDYSGGRKNIAALAPFVGNSGWLTCLRFGVRALDSEDALILAGFTDDEQPLDESACRRLFDLPGSTHGDAPVPATVEKALADALSRRQAEFLEALSAKNGQWFDTEMERLDHWPDDRCTALKAELEELDQEIKETKKAARLAPNLPDKLELQRKLRGLETKRDDAWRTYDAASRDIDRQKDALLDEISRRLEHKTECETLLTLRWRLA